MDIRKALQNQIIFLDGALGTMLQQAGMSAGEYPDTWSVTRPAILRDIHTEYIRAGCNIITANTFGASAPKLAGSGYTVKEVTAASVARVKEAIASEQAGNRCAAGLDIGPSGKLLKPLGDLAFENAVSYFAEVVKAGAEAGAEVILIETFSDLYELKAAVLAAKENCDLPVFATVTPDKDGRLLTGGDLGAVTALLEGFRVDALGINCGLGPREMLPLLDGLLSISSVPVILTPNAGLPRECEGTTRYDLLPDAFAELMEQAAKTGAAVLGGCCGTTPEHMRAMIHRCRGISPVPVSDKERAVVCSYAGTAALGGRTILVGERINPTGKPKLKQALRDGDYAYISRLALEQGRQGADILDINTGLPDIDEPEVLVAAIEAVQTVTGLPLQLDSADPKALAAAMRVYNGKPMVNSVSGKQSSMDAVFPLVQKYGGVLVALTLDDGGIPETAEGRLEIAKRILKEAGKYGIPKKEIVFDPLTMAVSAGEQNAAVTLRALRIIREELSSHTILGVSNISFGLPERERLNAAMLTAAMAAGLSAAIINPGSAAMSDAYRSTASLLGYDPQFLEYTARFANTEKPAAAELKTGMTLRAAIESGLQQDAAEIAAQLMAEQSPLSVIDGEIVPALNAVGGRFEKGTLFLPQLLMSAGAAKAAFGVINQKLGGGSGDPKGTVVVATVAGDIHDIGKNIAKALLENYRYKIIDLGRDVPPETVLKAAAESGAGLVGLSALMTTTVGSMRETVRLLKENLPGCRVMVGGAVLNQRYADDMGADVYVRDAMASVRFANTVFGSGDFPE